MMDVTDKLKKFLSTKDENYVSSLKEHCFVRLQVDKNDAGEIDLSNYDKKRLDLVFTKDYILESFVEIPGGFAEFLDLVEDFIEPISEIILHFLSSYFVNMLEGTFFSKLKNDLDTGSDRALQALANQVLKKLDKDDISSPKQEYQVLRNLLVNLNGNIFKLLMQAILSVHLGLEGTAKMQIQHALKLLINKLTPYKLQHSVVEVSAIKNKAKMSGKEGSKKRWALKSKVKAEAYRLRDEMKKTGKFRNDLQASKSLADGLCLFAGEIGAPFTEPFTAQMRIYKWFNEERKKQVVV